MFLGFGEVMMRVAPEHKLRLRQVLPGRVEITWGGGEANVCASLAMLGNQTRYVSAYRTMHWLKVSRLRCEGWELIPLKS